MDRPDARQRDASMCAGREPHQKDRVIVDLLRVFRAGRGIDQFRDAGMH